MASIFLYVAYRRWRETPSRTLKTLVTPWGEQVGRTKYIQSKNGDASMATELARRRAIKGSGRSDHKKIKESRTTTGSVTGAVETFFITSIWSPAPAPAPTPAPAPVGDLATDVTLRGPSGIAFDAIGNMFISEGSGHRVRRVDAVTKIITVIAGTGASSGPSGNGGPATSAVIFVPFSITIDASGNIVIAEANRLRVVNAVSNIITQMSTESGFDQIQFGPDGFLYGVYAGINRVRRVNAGGSQTDVVGLAGSGSSTGDGGPASAARLNRPRGIAFDASGNMFIAEGSGNRIRRVDAVTNIITTVASVTAPANLAFGSDGFLYAGSSVHVVYKINTSNGTVTTVVGTGAASSTGDGGPASAATLNNPRGIAFDASGNMFIAESVGNRVRRVDAVSKIITTVAGK